MSWLFTSGALNSQASPSASSLPMNIQAWFTLGLTDLISLVSKELSKGLLRYQSLKASVAQCSAFFIVQLSHSYVTTGKTIALTRRTFIGKVTSLLFNMLSRLVKAFLPSSKCLLTSWLQSPSAVTLEPPKINFYFQQMCYWKNKGFSHTVLKRERQKLKPQFPLPCLIFFLL